MRALPIVSEYVEGAVSLESGEGWIRPWRLPFRELPLFAATLVERAECTSGVRLRFDTDATALGLRFDPLPTSAHHEGMMFDVTVGGDLVQSIAAPRGATSVCFSGLPPGWKTLEVWLPQECGVRLRGMDVNDGAECRAVEDRRPKWVTYGSSLTHCVRAHSPARIWPAIVARHHGLNLTSLGYGGNCCLEPLVGCMIRDLPADFISLKLGINCISGALSPRTFPSAVVGLVKIIREKHPQTPIALISPIAYPPNEEKPNILNYTIAQMRADIADMHRRLVELGDGNLYYFDGLSIFNEREIAYYTTDQCHPNGDGIEVMARHFLETVMAFPPIRNRILPGD